MFHLHLLVREARVSSRTIPTAPAGTIATAAAAAAAVQF